MGKLNLYWQESLLTDRANEEKKRLRSVISKIKQLLPLVYREGAPRKIIEELVKDTWVSHSRLESILRRLNGHIDRNMVTCSFFIDLEKEMEGYFERAQQEDVKYTKVYKQDCILAIWLSAIRFDLPPDIRNGSIQLLH